ncbi:hypothetical protein V495_03056 [Pseudogymnoascus sp. VKM F-4514 (FW-929)]|nr:hypothetical protein V490_01370 [Pseudogymnoascus sp. VKM F-3557]KFY45307.1 hypothetical protein V495_03056 [Pseudogymnoascus sp. VKM F-4514 (FW-929)]KFY58260.1 hypothetical protein V497_04918 [Pseudogymnoascus sp. VKM F-4516 (FW-969)]
MGSTDEGSYTAPPQEAYFCGLLFDMDGTIIDSTDAVVKHWHEVGKEIGVDPNVILETSHGRRSIDVLQIISPEKANWDYVCKMESQIPALYGADAVEIPGARSLCDSLSATTPPVPWAIVTSGTSPLVAGWLRILKLPTPEHLVTAESVANGKPDPQGYLMGAKSLKLDPKGLLVLEDSPAGIKAGKAAGCRVLGVATTHTAKEVKEAGADWVVEDLRSVVVDRVGEGVVVLKISNGWVAN